MTKQQSGPEGILKYKQPGDESMTKRIIVVLAWTFIVSPLLLSLTANRKKW